MKQFKYINNMFYLGASDFRCDSGMFIDMAKPAELLLQYETPMVHFFDYVPKRVVNVSAEVAYARKFIYAFKNGSEMSAPPYNLGQHSQPCSKAWMRM